MPGVSPCPHGFPESPVRALFVVPCSLQRAWGTHTHVLTARARGFSCKPQASGAFCLQAWQGPSPSRGTAWVLPKAHGGWCVHGESMKPVPRPCPCLRPAASRAALVQHRGRVSPETPPRSPFPAAPLPKAAPRGRAPLSSRPKVDLHKVGSVPTQQPQPPAPRPRVGSPPCPQPRSPTSPRPGRRRWPSLAFPHRGSGSRFAKQPGGKAPAGPAAEETFALPPGSQGAEPAGRSPSRAFCWVSALGRKALVFPTLSDTF